MGDLMTTDMTKVLTMELAVTMPGYMEMHDCYPHQKNENFGFDFCTEDVFDEPEFDDSYIGRFAQEVLESKHNRARRRKATVARHNRTQRMFAMFGDVDIVPKYRQKLHHETSEKVSKMEAVARDRTVEDAKIARTPDFLLEDAQLQKEIAEFDAEAREFEEHEKAVRRAENMRKAYYNLEGCSTMQLLEMALQYAEDCDSDYATALNESLKFFLAREMTK